MKVIKGTIESIETEQEKECFDLTVERDHNFFCNRVLVSNCHHVREGKFELKNEYFYVAQSINAFYRFGFTATPGQPKSLDRKFLEAATGPIIHRVTEFDLEEKGLLMVPDIYFIEVDCPHKGLKDFREARESNLFTPWFGEIISRVASKFPEYKVLIIVDWVKKHLKKLHEMMPDAEVLYGSQNKQERMETRDRVINGEINKLISTVVKEGVDFKPLEITIKAAGGKKDINLIQQLGRNMRILEGKRKPVFIDFIHRDDGVLYKHSRERIRTLKKQGYKVNVLTLDKFLEKEI